MADIDEMDATELRVAMARSLETMIFLQGSLRQTREQAEALQKRLTDPEDAARMKPEEGIPTKYGILKRTATTKGKAWVVKDEVDKDAGELPEELRPQKDQRVVVEHLSDLSTGLQAELRTLAEAEEPVVVMTEKAKYPTVAKLRAEFGEETKYVGKPPKEHLVVLVKGEGEDALQVGIGGLV